MTSKCFIVIYNAKSTTLDIGNFTTLPSKLKE